MKKKIQLLEKEIAEPNQFVRITEELDNGYDKLTGILFLEKVGKNCLITSSSIDGKEVFPKNFEVENLQSNLAVAPDDRFFSIHDQKAKGCSIDIEFKDGGRAENYPYTLKIHLRLEDDKH